MKKAKQLIYTLTYLLTVHVFPSDVLAQTLKRPNIVLIVADDHGTDAIGCYGNKIIKTPNIDLLAAEGVRFTNAFGTTASCSPSRSVLLTGVHNHANGMYGLEHSVHHFSSFTTVKSLPVVLAAGGYHTARVGKFHVAPETVFSFHSVFSVGLANDPNTLGRSPVEMADKCREIINNKQQPFFLYYASDDPHRSNGVLTNGMPTFNSYPHPNLFGNRKQSYPGVDEVIYNAEEVIVPPFLPDNKATRAEIAQYYQSVSRLDQGVGRLITLLKEAGQYDNTLIIYLSDNGIAFPGAKTSLYDPGIKLPLIVKTPGRNNKNVVRDPLVSWVDITPTILEYAGVKTNLPAMNGVSFKKVLENADEQGQSQIFASHSFHEVTMYYPMRAIRNKRYKLIYNIANKLPFPFALDLVESSAWQSVLRGGSAYFGKRKRDAFIYRTNLELYDVQKDPNEIDNLAYQNKYQAVLQDLLKKLKQFQKETNDPWFHKWSYQ